MSIEGATQAELQDIDERGDEIAAAMAMNTSTDDLIGLVRDAVSKLETWREGLARILPKVDKLQQSVQHTCRMLEIMLRELRARGIIVPVDTDKALNVQPEEVAS